ncbi:MAG: hypothetical protein AAGF88_11490 [Pseudomonadota bacterium]
MSEETASGQNPKVADDPNLDWMISIQEFGYDQRAAVDFMIKRERLIRKATSAGVPREVFLPFEPSKPGFEHRIKVLMALPKAMQWE